MGETKEGETRSGHTYFLTGLATLSAFILIFFKPSPRLENGDHRSFSGLWANRSNKEPGGLHPWALSIDSSGYTAYGFTV